MNSFKALTTGTPFTPNNFGLFSNPSSAASGKRPQIHELWFQHSSANGSKKIFPINPYERPDSSVPLKPKKLTPLYSKKRSEITNIEEKKESVKKSKKSKTSKKLERIESKIVEPINIVESLEFAQPEILTETKKEETIESKPLTSPKNPIELIWSTESLLPKIEDNTSKQLPTIGEDISLNLTRAKSFLGGRVFKDFQDEDHKLNSDIFNKNTEEKPLDLKSDDSAVLLINSASSSSSISNKSN